MSQHEKTIRWDEPTGVAERALSMDGLSFLEAIAAGEIPGAPIGAHMNMEVMRVSRGEVSFDARPDASHYNPIGSVHGGFYATLLDSVCGCAVHSTLPLGQAYSSLELKVSFLRQITAETGVVTARGWVTKPGRQAAFAEGEIRDSADKLLASASSTCLVFSLTG